MKYLKLTLILICMVTFVDRTSAQDFTTPAKYKLESQEDYTKLEPDILKCIDYLEAAPFDDDLDKQKRANAFFMKWLTGTAHVSVEILPYVMDLTKENKEFLLTFMGGWTKYALENPDSTEKAACHLAGLKAIIRVYQQNKTVEEDDAVAELVTLDKEGKLNDWLQPKLKTK
ncbi:MAG: hypothetical protein HY961_17820 [Ignavibacteriae bacterium]|nr:hypothetical protein [Ignavibacteriota bacterium]